MMGRSAHPEFWRSEFPAASAVTRIPGDVTVSINQIRRMLMNTSKPRVFRTVLTVGVLTMAIALALSIFSVAKVLSAPQMAVTIPSTIGFEGFLVDESTGDPLDGTYAITFSMYSAATGGSLIWTETLDAVAVTDGLYAVELGASVPFGASAFDGARWVGVTVGDGIEMTPRTKISSVPFALNAESANDADTVDGQHALELGVPAGAIVMWSGSPGSIPAGWALCDGSNGTPDLSGRFIVGYDSLDTDYDTIGEAGGEATHVLTTAEMPSHDHGGATLANGAHSHSIKYYTGSGSNNAVDRRRTSSGAWMGGTTNSTGNHTHSISSEGGGQAHENRPPYFVVAYIIKLAE
jgi:microcystin-dependent protein